MRHGLKYIAVKRLMARYDIVIIGYSPHFAELAAAFHEIYGIRVIAISSHRYNQHKKHAASLAKLNECVKHLAQIPQAVKAVAGEYDYDYERYYLNINPHCLFARPGHVRPGVIETPRDNIILMAGKKDKIDEMPVDWSAAYEGYCQKHNMTREYSLRPLRKVH